MALSVLFILDAILQLRVSSTVLFSVSIVLRQQPLLSDGRATVECQPAPALCSYLCEVWSDEGELCSCGVESMLEGVIFMRVGG